MTRTSEGDNADRAREPQTAGGHLAPGEPLYHLYDAVVVTDLEDRITGWNPAATALYGWEAAEAIGRTFSELVPLDRGPGGLSALVAGPGGQGGWRGELRQGCRDGRTITTLTTVALMRGPDGAPTGTVSVHRDTGAWAQGEAELRAHAERMEILAEASQIFALAGNDEGEVLEQVARSTAEPLGAGCIVRLLSADGQWLPAATLYDPDPATQAVLETIYATTPVHIDDQNMSAEVVRTGQPVFIPVVDLAAMGNLVNSPLWPTFERARPYSIIIVPLRARGSILGALSFTRHRPGRPAFTGADLALAQDLADRAALALANARLFQQAQRELAERQQAERALEAERALLARRVAERTADLSLANAELARAARLKDEFLASMSHELRTPLTAILGRAEALQEGVYGLPTAAQLTSLRGIEESGQHLLALINDILDLSRIETGQLSLERSPIEIDILGTMALRIVSQAALGKRITLHSSFDSGVALLVADERRLKQILVNLLDNAVKFTPTGGNVGLEVRGDPEQREVRFTVWDTGIGIAPENMGRLFQPFVQLDSRLSRQYGGTGLGLALVLRLAQAHEGGVSVESTPGQGSRFSVTLPWVLPEAPAVDPGAALTARLADPQVRATPAAGPGGRPPRLLLADDNEATLETLCDYLAAQGYELLPARNGVEAIHRTLEERPDVVLMDIQMPGTDGLAAIRELRATGGLGHVPIIAVTALAMPGDRERCLTAGADAYLAKPVSLRTLVATIEALRAMRAGA